MSPDHARALAMAYELQSVLDSIAERRDNRRFETALDLLDGVLDELDTQPSNTLRLIVVTPRQGGAAMSTKDKVTPIRPPAKGSSGEAPPPEPIQAG